MIPTPRGPDIPPPPPPFPGPGGREPAPSILALKAMEDIEDLKKDIRALLARVAALERRVAAIEDARTV